jgi:hypothetical protein
MSSDSNSAGSSDSGNSSTSAGSIGVGISIKNLLRLLLRKQAAIQFRRAITFTKSKDHLSQAIQIRLNSLYIWILRITLTHSYRSYGALFSRYWDQRLRMK